MINHLGLFNLATKKMSGSFRELANEIDETATNGELNYVERAMKIITAIHWSFESVRVDRLMKSAVALDGMTNERLSTSEDEDDSGKN